jgi:hypothetical protein
MTARTRKKLNMPPLFCQVPSCGEEYKPIGDYTDTYRAAELGGWLYRAGQYLCPGHRDHVPWWPGPPLLALPVREPGATRAEFLGVVRDTPALPAPPDVPRSGSEVTAGSVSGSRREPENLAGPGDLHDLRQRLYAKLAPCPEPGCACDCLRWTGEHDRDGYGRIAVDGHKTGVHRVAWQIEIGPIPEGLVIDHVVKRGCVHRDCARTDHLEPVTVAVNSLRGNTLNAMNAAKEVCDNGHEFDAANTYLRPDGRRCCRTCKRERKRVERAARYEDPGDTQGACPFCRAGFGEHICFGPPVTPDTQPLPVLPHRDPGQALANAEADDQAQHDATALLVRSGVDPADIAALAAPEPGEDTP